MPKNERVVTKKKNENQQRRQILPFLVFWIYYRREFTLSPQII